MSLPEHQWGCEHTCVWWTWNSALELIQNRDMAHSSPSTEGRHINSTNLSMLAVPWWRHFSFFLPSPTLLCISTLQTNMASQTVSNFNHLHVSPVLKIKWCYRQIQKMSKQRSIWRLMSIWFDPKAQIKAEMIPTFPLLHCVLSLIQLLVCNCRWWLKGKKTFEIQFKSEDSKHNNTGW